MIIIITSLNSQNASSGTCIKITFDVEADVYMYGLLNLLWPEIDSVTNLCNESNDGLKSIMLCNYGVKSIDYAVKLWHEIDYFV